MPIIKLLVSGIQQSDIRQQLRTAFSESVHSGTENLLNCLNYNFLPVIFKTIANKVTKLVQISGISFVL